MGKKREVNAGLHAPVCEDALSVVIVESQVVPNKKRKMLTVLAERCFD